MLRIAAERVHARSGVSDKGTSDSPRLPRIEPETCFSCSDGRRRPDDGEASWEGYWQFVIHDDCGVAAFADG